MTSLQKWGKSVRTTIPVMAGYLVLGAGFGILLRTRGYGLGWALAMSAFIYAGSMQYVAIDLLTGGASLLTTAVTTLLVNARHLFYGISMLERYRAAGRYAPYLIFSLTDETYSLVAAREDLTGAECFRISLLDQLYWVLVTALIRFAPFLVFRGGRETPAVILRLGKLLPCAVMSMLVVYCLRNMDFAGASHALPEIIAAAVVVLLHVWRRNTLLSIVAGTVVYMLLVQLAFV